MKELKIFKINRQLNKNGYVVIDAIANGINSTAKLDDIKEVLLVSELIDYQTKSKAPFPSMQFKDTAGDLFDYGLNVTTVLVNTDEMYDVVLGLIYNT